MKRTTSKQTCHFKRWQSFYRGTALQADHFSSRTNSSRIYRLIRSLLWRSLLPAVPSMKVLHSKNMLYTNVVRSICFLEYPGSQRALTRFKAVRPLSVPRLIVYFLIQHFLVFLWAAVCHSEWGSLICLLCQIDSNYWNYVDVIFWLRPRFIECVFKVCEKLFISEQRITVNY